MAEPTRIDVLIVDDDAVLASMLADYLNGEGCQCQRAASGEQALEMLESMSIDIVLMDIMMPGMGGIEALKKIRTTSLVPVLMLTARGDDLDRILGLELGADDYIPKPCNPRELLARIRAVLRRSGPPDGAVDEAVTIGDLSMNPGDRSTSVAARALTLTQTEFDLLNLLVRQPGQVVTKQELSKKVLGRSLGQWDRSIDVHISNLRRKLGPHPDDSLRIRTLRGSGYLYVADTGGSGE